MTPDRQVQAAIVIFLLLAVLASRVVTPLWALTRHLTAYLWWMVVLTAAWGQGAILLRLIVPHDIEDEPELRAAVTMGLGLGVLSIESFFLGLAGYFTRPALTLLVLLVIAGCMAVLGIPRGVRLPKWEKPERNSQGPLILAGLAVIVSLLYVLVPPIFFDAMSYHLELPSRYLQAGRIFHLEENLYSGYPQLTEVLYGLGLALDGVVLAGLVSLTSFILTLLLLWGWGRKRFGDEGASWGLAILALSPPLMLMVSRFQNDWLAAFFTLAAVFMLMRGSRKAGIMIIAGALAGLAAGCKYNAIAFAAAAPLAAGIINDLFRKDKFHVGSWCIFAIAGMVTASPWYIKNLVFTGDPLYPMLAGLTGKIQGLMTLAHDTHFHGLAWSDLWGWLTVPYLAVFRFWDLQFDISLGFLPVVLLPTLLSLRGSRTGSRYLGIWALLYLIAWYLSFRVGRFLLPLLALGFLYLGAGVARSALPASPWGRAMRAVTALLLLAGIGSSIGFDAVYLNRTAAALGTMGPASYLMKNYPPYGAIEYLNELDPLPREVLFLGEMRGFYSQFPREVATFETPNRLVELIRRGLTVEQIREELVKGDFSHILINSFEMGRLAEKSPFLKLDTDEESVLREFFSSQTRLVFEEKGVYVFAII